MVFWALAVNSCQKSWPEQNEIKRKTIIQKGSLKKQHICLINCSLLIYSLTAIISQSFSASDFHFEGIRYRANQLFSSYFLILFYILYHIFLPLIQIE